ncbi:hypothetical protein GCM10010383_47440 [Streptomyces lomondensis]|uniref:Uncharacterized protein n=1 Tax=Streptomyces lomondensis TaxID=68229 RepID=A0ABQ2XE63_9ACTN|nr:hypothetical protein GCM10010383_47440 [Streptomyces lomondensis]
MPEAREDARGDVQHAHEGTGSADEERDGLGAWSAQQAAHPARPARTSRTASATRNLTRHFLICPDRHRIPLVLRETLDPVPIRASGDIAPSRTVSRGERFTPHVKAVSKAKESPGQARAKV